MLLTVMSRIKWSILERENTPQLKFNMHHNENNSFWCRPVLDPLTKQKGFYVQKIKLNCPLKGQNIYYTLDS